jgi:hypothetical protein
VYLRRIFESLIEEARNEGAKDSSWDDEEFTKSRMDEKILLLQDKLPSFLVENRGLYSILSKGIHSLTEEECLEYFNPVKVAIELILDEKIEQEQKRSKIEAAKKMQRYQKQANILIIRRADYTLVILWTPKSERVSVKS